MSSESESEQELLEVNIIEISSKQKDNNNVYFVTTECTLRTKINLLQCN